MNLVKYIDIIRVREEEIGKLVELISEKSDKFTQPKLIVTGGYALRAFVPFSRATRDCDFVLKKNEGWHLDKIKTWLPKGVSIEALEKHDSYGYMRWIKLLEFAKSAKVSVDFMEGQVVGRTEKQVVPVDNNFIENSKKTKIEIGDKEYEVFVPSYVDYLILKTVSSRPSDIRDITTLVWKRDIPKDIKKRVKELLPYPEVFTENLRNSIKIISDKRFLNSWRGTFVTTELTEEDKNEAIEKIQKIL